MQDGSNCWRNRTIWNSLVSLVLITVCSCSNRTLSETYRPGEDIRSAFQFYKLGKMDSCAMRIRMVEESSRDFPVALLLSAFIAAKSGAWTSVQSDLNRILQRPSAVPEIEDISHMFLAYLDYIEQPPKLAAAAKKFLEITNRSPFYDESRIGLGWCFVLVQDFIRAEEYFREVVANLPGSVFVIEARYCIGLLEFFKKNYAGAIAQFDSAIAGDALRHRPGIGSPRLADYDIATIKEQAEFSKLSALCVQDIDSTSSNCRKVRQLTGGVAVPIGEWKMNHRRILEDIELLSSGFLQELLVEETLRHSISRRAPAYRLPKYGASKVLYDTPALLEL